jgi:hypothetical protein
MAQHQRAGREFTKHWIFISPQKTPRSKPAIEIGLAEGKLECNPSKQLRGFRFFKLWQFWHLWQFWQSALHRLYQHVAS